MILRSAELHNRDLLLQDEPQATMKTSSSHAWFTDHQSGLILLCFSAAVGV